MGLPCGFAPRMYEIDIKTDCPQLKKRMLRCGPTCSGVVYSEVVGILTSKGDGN